LTNFFRSHVSLTNFFKKTFQGWVFQNRSYVSKTPPKFFLSPAKRAVANSGSDSSLLLFFSNGCDSTAIEFNK